MVRAEIIAIGSELLLGGVADTNSLYLAEELLKIGIQVRYKTVVGDDPTAFWRENADIVVAMSQVLPRQCFMYYVQSAPPQERREAFLIAQRGQVLAADEGIDRSAVTQPRRRAAPFRQATPTGYDGISSSLLRQPYIEILYWNRLLGRGLSRRVIAEYGAATA